MDDAALVNQAREGSSEAFAGIYDRYADRLFGFLCTVTGNRDDAADALQDTFVLAASRLGQLRDPDKLRPWLYAIARHVALRGLGRAARLEPIEGLEVTETAAGPAEVARQVELAELIEQSAAGLSPRDRVILDLHLRQGLEGKELGEAIGVSAGHADVLMSRLRDQVERSLGALLVARMGRKECAQLQELLSGWDGRFTATWRKRVARHVDKCSVCDQMRKGLISPASLLSTLPMIPVPGELKGKILEQVKLVGSTQTLGAEQPTEKGWGRDGFPPPMFPSRRRRGLAATLAAAACLLIAFMFPRLGMLPLAGGGPVPTSTTLPVSPLSFNNEALVSSPFAGPTVVTTAVPPIATSTPPGAGTTRPRGSTTRPPTTTSRPATTTSSRPSTTLPAGLVGSTTQPAGDTEPPALRNLSASPATITATGGCGSGAQRSRISVSATDSSGIDRVLLKWSGPQPGSATMGASGSTFSATVGPFPGSVVPPSGSVNVPYTVTATDEAGNMAGRGGTLKLVCTDSSFRGLVVPTTTSSRPPIQPAG